MSNVTRRQPDSDRPPPVPVMGGGAGSVHRRPDPRDAGTEHLGRIRWPDDTLPDLALTLATGEAFDRVIVCAVRQYLNTRERAGAMPGLARLLAPDGVLLMILRHEPNVPRGSGGDTQRDDAERLARAAGLRVAFAREGKPLHDNPTPGATLTWLAFEAEIPAGGSMPDRIRPRCSWIRR